MTEDRELLHAAGILKSLAHPARLDIARRLWQDGACNVAYLQQCLAMPQSTMSQHLARLRSGGIIEGERDGVEIFYHLKSAEAERLLQVIFSEEVYGKNDDTEQ